MGAYVVGEDGVLERHTVEPEEELRPLTASPRSLPLARIPLGARAALDPPAPATRTQLTISGANSPCSTTPGVALSRAASSAGSPIGPK